jgi:hypothetical protein
MDRDFDTLAEKIAEYIGVVQPQLDKIAYLESSVTSMKKQAEQNLSEKVKFIKRATESCNTLSEAGLISKDEINSIVDTIASDQSKVWDLVEKVASSVGPSTLGARSNETASVSSMDPWVREFGGYTNADNGMID